MKNIMKPGKTIERAKSSFGRWFHSLSFKISICQIAFILLMISATITIMVTLERSALRKKSYEFIEQIGNKIISDLDEHISMTESLTTSLANIGEILEPDEKIYRELIPHVLNYAGYEDIIAGGGVWPEPYTFDQDVERRSFFWGRDDAGSLKYYDEYNDPEGAGYHNEEWYVPASVYPEKKAFWSKSYMDPYSYQPMVTCTVPMYKGQDFVGVSTIDLKLEGLHSFFEEEAKLIGGYIFAVDRNNKFLSFPREDLVKTYTPDAKGAIVEEFVHSVDLAKKDSRFQPISSALGDINAKIIENAQKKDSFNRDLSQYIDNQSYQINAEEALLITSVMLDPLKMPVSQNKELKRLFLKDDLLLNQPVIVSVFHMPRTYWKIVTVSPVSVANREADLLTAKVALFVLVSESLLLWIMFIFMNKLLVKPIKKMSKDLAEMSRDSQNFSGKLDESSKDELGDLACQFNRRTDQLYDTFESLRKTTTSIDNLNREIAMRKDSEERVKQAQAKLEKQVDDLTLARKSLLKITEDYKRENTERKNAEEKIKTANQQLRTNEEQLSRSNRELEQAVRTLEAVNTELKDFVYIASHDLREPLRKISSFGELLKNSLTGKLEADDLENFEFMIDGADRMTKMIEGLLAYSRLSKDSESFMAVDLNELLEQLKQLELNILLEETGTTIEVSDNMPKVFGDEVQLKQLLQNLISNAVRYRAEDVQPRITITAEQVGEKEVKIEVRDNGIGIEKKYYSDIFKMFRRLHSRQEYEGTGIGLAVCKKIIDKHKGRIGVESQLGKGSTFWFILPLAGEAALSKEMAAVA